MLPREKRLSKSKDIRKLLKNGKRLIMDGISLYVTRGRGRIGFITAKGFKNAVSRNRAKRRVRGAFESEDIYLDNYDLLFVIKPEVLGLDFEKIKEIIKELVFRIRDEEIDISFDKVL
ncbi:MAG: ribonuclease P protein component [bacterium]|nr:ribonuclease P protein component [bacterium]